VFDPGLPFNDSATSSRREDIVYYIEKML
jgi:hypothetical protein